ncbi:hypothetical protein B0H11DRAFT_1917001 [Mycena galericulata]|nr:hypothetical protein B0H11DRAFT_1917001 [Mycena galericulata]
MACPSPHGSLWAYIQDPWHFFWYKVQLIQNDTQVVQPGTLFQKPHLAEHFVQHVQQINWEICGEVEKINSVARDSEIARASLDLHRRGQTWMWMVGAHELWMATSECGKKSESGVGITEIRTVKNPLAKRRRVARKSQTLHAITFSLGG